MILLSGELHATRTYAARTWSWVGRSDASELADGTLSVNFVKGRTGRARVETRRYDVQEVPCDHGRQFLFLKEVGQPDPSEQDIYCVTVLDNGSISCTCKADNCHAPCCVHKDVVPALIEAGAFDPDIDPPADPPVSEAEIEDMADAYESERSGLWFPPEPPEPPADGDELPACFLGIGSSERPGIPF